MNKSELFLDILISEIEDVLKDVDGDIIDKLIAAMRITKNHWLVTDADVQFRGAIAGVMIHYGEKSEEFKKLAWEVDQLRKLEVAVKAGELGVPVSFDFLLNSDEGYKPIELMKLWKEVRGL